MVDPTDGLASANVFICVGERGDPSSFTVNPVIVECLKLFMDSYALKTMDVLLPAAEVRRSIAEVLLD